MNSEKVKEIKKALEHCINDCSGNYCPYDKYEKGLKCIDDLQKDALTLINELESENETKTHTIADLLKKQEFYETEKLKQFAEKLKNKFDHSVSGIIYRTDSIDKKIDETLKEFIEK